MKILITGGNGFVGSHLSETLSCSGHSIIAVGLSDSSGMPGLENCQYISADTTRQGDWQQQLEEVDAVINLTGATIFHKWSRRYKELIRTSRIHTTRRIVEGLPSRKNIVLLNASAAGYYGNRGEDILTERDGNGNDFLAEVCRDWEQEAYRAEEKGTRVATTRFGIVLGKDGGALKTMSQAFNLGMGGPLGSGRQWFPWIHIKDLCRAALHILENENLHGPFNFTAPGTVRQKDFANRLARIMHRPAFMPAPAFMVRMTLGELGAAIMMSQRLKPAKLLESGFEFEFPESESALMEIMG